MLVKNTKWQEQWLKEEKSHDFSLPYKGLQNILSGIYCTYSSNHVWITGVLSSYNYAYHILYLHTNSFRRNIKE